jgi:metallo-beta-lactamase family protein
MLADSAHIQEKDAEFLARREKEFVEPLYGMRHAVRTMELMVGVPYNKPFDVVPGVRGTYVDAGHILGSASVVLDCTENGITKRLVFSGDIGRSGLAIIRDPMPPTGADAVIMESTYGNRDHESVDGARAHLARVIRETAARGGRVLIPAFAVGRTQELLYSLHSLLREGAIPPLPVYVDSPLAIDTTTVFEMHPETFDQSEDMVKKVRELFDFPLLKFTRDVEESKAINFAKGPMIIIAASGMVEAGRILHHLAHGASDPRNTILIVGFQAEHTLGRRIVEKQPILKIFGDEVPLRAQVEIINGYSAHADRTELTAWIDKVKSTSPDLGPIWLVHGEPDVQDEYKASLVAKGYSVSCPEPHTRAAF